MIMGNDRSLWVIIRLKTIINCPIRRNYIRVQNRSLLETYNKPRDGSLPTKGPYWPITFQSPLNVHYFTLSKPPN